MRGLVRPLRHPEPGRPLELRFKGPSSAKADFPGLHGLEQERERGRLLHFIGDHGRTRPRISGSIPSPVPKSLAVVFH